MSRVRIRGRRAGSNSRVKKGKTTEKTQYDRINGKIIFPDPRPDDPDNIQRAGPDEIQVIPGDAMVGEPPEISRKSP